MKTTIALRALVFLVVGSMLVLADDKPTSLSDARAAVEANLRTPEGKAYDQQLGKEFPQKYLPSLSFRSDLELITADFTYVRWLGDRKGIEEKTKTWDKVIVDRRGDLSEWVELLKVEIPGDE